MHSLLISFFFFNDTATTEIYTLSLHDALPIWLREGLLLQLAGVRLVELGQQVVLDDDCVRPAGGDLIVENYLLAQFNKSNRSEEHTSELQSRLHLVCRLLLEKKKKSIGTKERP